MSLSFAAGGGVDGDGETISPFAPTPPPPPPLPFEPRLSICTILNLLRKRLSFGGGALGMQRNSVNIL